MLYFAGIEGGATHSTLVLIDENGHIVAWAEGSGTNFYLTPFKECLQIIDKLVKDALNSAGLPATTRLKSLGMALSGAEDENHNEEFVGELRSALPDLADCHYLTTDSVGTIATALENGGVVVIAGTGSTCRLLNTDGKVTSCGGWGHVISDQSSAFWIAQKAIQAVYDTEDGWNESQHDIAYVKAKMLEFFKIPDKFGVLDKLYKNFNKSSIAEFCKVLAEGAIEHKDPLCCQLFYDAGLILGQYVVTVCKHADKTLLNADGGLPVVTVGSVWKSFGLLRDGFIQGLRPRKPSDVRLTAVKLYRLKISTAVGAAILGAKRAAVQLPIDFKTNADVFYQTQL